MHSEIVKHVMKYSFKNPQKLGYEKANMECSDTLRHAEVERGDSEQQMTI